jgi:hypothetical protein
VEAEIFDFIRLRKLNIIDFNRWASYTPGSEGDMCRLGFIDFYPPPYEPVLNCTSYVRITISEPQERLDVFNSFYHFQPKGCNLALSMLCTKYVTSRQLL